MTPEPIYFIVHYVACNGDRDLEVEITSEIVRQITPSGDETIKTMMRLSAGEDYKATGPHDASSSFALLRWQAGSLGRRTAGRSAARSRKNDKHLMRDVRLAQPAILPVHGGGEVSRLNPKTNDECCKSVSWVLSTRKAATPLQLCTRKDIQQFIYILQVFPRLTQWLILVKPHRWVSENQRQQGQHAGSIHTIALNTSCLFGNVSHIARLYKFTTPWSI